VGVAYGPRPVPVSLEVLKKRKADAAEQVMVKRLKAHEKKRAETVKVTVVPEKRRTEIAKVTVASEKRRMKTVKVVVASEKKRMETAKVTVAQVKGGFKRLSNTDITSVKSVKLSKDIVPRTIASAAMARIVLEASSPKKCVRHFRL
jgi:hypothetical protein